MGTMVEICLFSNLPKLEKQIKELESDCTATKLVSLCKTRWVARIDALEVFFQLFEAIAEGSGSYWNTESACLARNLLKTYLRSSMGQER